MNYDLSVEQKLVKDSAHDFLFKEVDSTLVREMIKDEKGVTNELWKKMAELGWMGLLIPEPYGSSGMSFLDMTMVLYEMGYACLPGPFFSTAVTSVMCILDAGNEDQKKAILGDVAKGNRLLTVAWTEKGGTCSPEGISLRARRRKDSFVLSGTKLYVPDAHVADNIICVARTDEDRTDWRKGISLFLLDAHSTGISTHLLDSFTGEKLCEVNFEDVNVPKEGLLGEDNKGWHILQNLLRKAAVAKCAEMIGASRKVLELTIDHAKKRVQFGRPIGSFQAIQHHCANMLTYLDTSTFMTYQASWRISEKLPFDKEASMCKAWVSDSCRNLVSLAHQVMGGIGFMEEVDLCLYFNRAIAADRSFGNGDFHREMLAEELGL